MDGNGRWAEARGEPRTTGHRAGIEPVRVTIRECAKRGIAALTLFAFSSENWRRPEAEVAALMALFFDALDREVDELHANGVRVRVIGDRRTLSVRLQQRIAEAEARTAANAGLMLQVAVSYGGHWDILEAARKLARKVASGALRPEAIDEAAFAAELQLGGLPDPDLFIRTGGEQRISNFLLWNLAYAELYFTPTLWPDFGVADFDALALADFASARAALRHWCGAAGRAGPAPMSGPLAGCAIALLTALVLATVLVAVLFGLPAWATLTLILLAVLAGAWEWSALLGPPGRGLRVAYVPPGRRCCCSGSPGIVTREAAVLRGVLASPRLLVAGRRSPGWRWRRGGCAAGRPRGRAAGAGAGRRGAGAAAPSTRRIGAALAALRRAADRGGRPRRVLRGPRLRPRAARAARLARQDLGGRASAGCCWPWRWWPSPGRRRCGSASRAPAHAAGALARCGVFGRRRPHREHVQAPCGHQGQRQPVPRPRRDARPHRQHLRRRAGPGARPAADRGDPVIGVAILGSTGTIGVNTLDVLAQHPDRFRVVALGARRNVSPRCGEQCRQFRPDYAALADADAARELERDAARAAGATRVLAGEGRPRGDRLACPRRRYVMAGIVGAAGLPRRSPRRAPASA